MDNDHNDPIAYGSSDEESRYFVIAQTIATVYKFVAAVFGLGAVVLLFTSGYEWYWQSFYPLVSSILAVPVIFLLPTGLFLAIFKSTRGFSGILLLSSSLLYFSSAWLQSLAFAYIYAGKVWMVIGFLLAGVGVFFIAFVGALIQGQFLNAAAIILSIGLFLIFYFLGFHLSSSTTDSSQISGKDEPDVTPPL